MIASKYAARTNFMLHENAEDLASYFFIRCHVIHPLRVLNRRSHKLNPAASGRMELYPPLCTAMAGQSPPEINLQCRSLRRPSFLSFRVTTTTSKPTCLWRRLQHTQLGA